jgi:hypothetical protein
MIRKVHFAVMAGVLSAGLLMLGAPAAQNTGAQVSLLSEVQVSNGQVVGTRRLRYGTGLLERSRKS